MQPLAIITMVYNEAQILPTWLGHYNKQVGLEHCYVIDHGSTDGAASRNRKVNVTTLPRSPESSEQRLAAVKDMARDLLLRYRRVAFVEADELLVADPGRFEHLNAYAEAMTEDAVTSIGLEVVQGPEEKPLTLDIGVGKQRASAIFSSSMCKTNMVGKVVGWAPGWRAHDGPPRFDGLYLFHIRHADEALALDRLKVTREMQWADESAGAQMRVSDEHMRALLALFARRPLAEGTSILDPDGPMRAYLDGFIADTKAPAAPGGHYQVPLARYGRERIAIDPLLRKALNTTPR